MKYVRGYHFTHGDTYCFVFPGIIYATFNLEEGIFESDTNPNLLEELVITEIYHKKAIKLDPNTKELNVPIDIVKQIPSVIKSQNPFLFLAHISLIRKFEK